MSVLARPHWRLLDTGPHDGFTNMAVDEALLEVYAASGGSPLLRFYRWSPPALSLGYGQQIEADVNLERCRALGIDVVRRPTGGRAVLHDDEVTYSVVIREDDPLAAMGVLASYLMVSQALIRGLSHLGIAAALIPLRRPVRAPAQGISPVCFVSPSSYEVAVDGQKIIGSAQRRSKGVIMQHGSLPIRLDREMLFTVLRSPTGMGYSAHEEETFRARMTTLQEAGKQAYDYAEVIRALSRGFAETWDIELRPSDLTAEERRLSAHLRATKYALDAWTWQR
jgi:lipoate-protein ligase A